MSSILRRGWFRLSCLIIGWTGLAVYHFLPASEPLKRPLLAVALPLLAYVAYTLAQATHTAIKKHLK